MDSLLNETQVSERLQVSLACLRKWRLHGRGGHNTSRSAPLSAIVPRRSSIGLRNYQQEEMGVGRASEAIWRLPVSV